MGIALTLGLIAWIERPDSYGIDDLSLLIVEQIGLGLLVGVALGAAAIWVFGRLPHSIGAFAPVASVAAGALSFGVADVIGGSGFLAVYLVGLAVGSTPSRYRRQLVAFHEGLAFLAQVAIFIVFGLLVFPSELRDVALPGLALAILLMLVIRPAAVLASTLLHRPHAVGPAAARVGGPARRRPDRARHVRALVGRAARRHDLQRRLLRRRRLGRSSRARRSNGSPDGSGCSRRRRRYTSAPLEVGHLSKLELVDFVVAGNHAIAGSAVRELGLPRDALIAVITRGDDTIPPRGSTVRRARRPPLRARAAREARRPRGRLLALAPARLDDGQREQGLGGVQAVLRLVPGGAPGAVEDVRGDLLARMRRQAVEDDRLGIGSGEQRLVDGVAGERLQPLARARPPGPCSSRRRSTTTCAPRTASRGSRTTGDRRVVGLVARRRRADELGAEQRARLGEREADVVAVADPRDPDALERCRSAPGSSAGRRAPAADAPRR